MFVSGEIVEGDGETLGDASSSYEAGAGYFLLFQVQGVVSGLRDGCHIGDWSEVSFDELCTLACES